MQYTNTVMDHFMNPRNSGQLTDADGIGRLGSEECGDILQVCIKVHDGKLTKVTHEVFGCPAAIACCSMMTELATGMTLQQAIELTDADVAEALGGLPEPKYHCSNLAASALHKAIENYQSGETKKTETVQITTLVNNAMPAPLIAEHGLSFWIEYTGKKILFDTGQSEALIHNADLLDIDLSTTDAIVISHGHYDHTGGLKAVLELAPNATVYLHPDAAKMRYSCHPGKRPKDISMPPEACEKIASLFPKGKVIYTNKSQSIAAKLTVTGEIPRITDYEDTGGPFYLDKDARKPDPLNDDQSLIISSSKGLIIVLGCAHAGLVNTLEYAEKLFQEPVYAVIGGLHLKTASEYRIEQTLEALKRQKINCIMPCHCTGDQPIETIKNKFNTIFLDIKNHIRISI